MLKNISKGISNVTIMAYLSVSMWAFAAALPSIEKLLPKKPIEASAQDEIDRVMEGRERTQHKGSGMTPPLQRKFEVGFELAHRAAKWLEHKVATPKTAKYFQQDFAALPLPKVLVTHWQGRLDYDPENWVHVVRAARAEGYNGVYVVMGHNAVFDSTNEQIADIILAYLQICAQHNMELHVAFGGIEGTNEVSHTSADRFIRGTFGEGFQQMWGREENADSPMIQKVVEVCSMSPYSDYLKSITIMQQPQFINFLSKEKYEKAVRAIAQKNIWSVNAKIDVVVKSSNASLDLVAETMASDDDPRFIRAGHLYRESKRNGWPLHRIREAVEEAPPGAWIPMLHFNNKQGTEEHKSHFMVNALDMAVQRKMTVAVFGFCERPSHSAARHSLHCLRTPARKDIAEKIGELRAKGLLQPQLS